MTGARTKHVQGDKGTQQNSRETEWVYNLLLLCVGAGQGKNLNLSIMRNPGNPYGVLALKVSGASTWNRMV